MSHPHKRFVTTDEFVALVKDPTRCIICCRELVDVGISREHVLPNWILKKYKLHSVEITLPYGNDPRRYAGHTIPCCKDCNSLMGRKLEQPVRRLLEPGYSVFQQQSLPYQLIETIFVWLSWIFLKLLIKDGTILVSPDRREEAAMQDQEVDWVDLHHIYCVARTPYSGAQKAAAVLGTTLILPMEDSNYREEFHFTSIHQSQTILIRLGDIALLANLSDSSGSMETIYNCVLPKEQKSFLLVEVMEICAELATTSLRIRDRPEYYTETNKKTGQATIKAKLPPCCFINPLDPEKRASIFKLVFRNFLEIVATRNPDKDIFGALERNQLTFLRHKIALQNQLSR
jgi:hypothetical protein